MWAQAYAAQTLAYLRRYDEAVTICRKILEYAPDNLYARWVLGVALTNSGANDEAISEFLKRKVTTASTNWALGYAYGVSGRKEEARKILDFHLELQRRKYIWPAIVAIQYIGLGENAKALGVLEKAEADHEDHYLQRAKLDPYFDRIRNEPRFQRIIERMNFPK